MKMQNSTVQAFFSLVQAGLWEQNTNLSEFTDVDFSEIYQLAVEQSVAGLIAAGFEHCTGLKPSRQVLLPFMGEVLQLEQRNKAMNQFIAELVQKMRNQGIYTLVVKGQGIAQCYERPLWRACGDIDFLLSDDNYKKAKEYLQPLASSTDEEYEREKHLGMTIDNWIVELHGRLYSGLSSKIENELDELLNDTFYCGAVRLWDNNGVPVFQLAVENDVFYVFTHILQHFYKEGVGLRQICDWCRLLWTYRETICIDKLESRIRSAGVMTEWKAFAAYAVEYLGMPVEAMPFYSEKSRWKRKAKRINKFVLEVGNMGHNRDHSYFEKYPYLLRKVFSFSRRCGDLIRHARIFPMDSLRFFPNIMYNGLRSAAKGEG